MAKESKKQEVVVVNVKNSNQPNGCWKISETRANKSGVLVSEENEEVKRVYTFSSVKKHSDGRVSFRDFKRVTDPKELRKYSDLDLSRKRGEANPVRYRYV